MFLYDSCHIIHLFHDKGNACNFCMVFVWFRVYVFKLMFYMTVFHIYGSMEIIMNEYKYVCE